MVAGMKQGQSAADAPVDPYADMAQVDRLWLSRAADELRVKLRRSVQEVVESGRLLAAARRRLGRDRWRPWLASCAQIPLRSAGRLVNVGRAFGTINESSLRNFTPTAIYALAEPGVPTSIREYFIERAKEGEEVTAGDVTEMLGLQRDTDTTGVSIKLASKDETPPDDYHDPADVFARENWLILRELVGTSGTIYLCGTPDAENADEVFSGFTIGADGRRKYAAGGTVEAVVLKLSGGVRKKVCACCGLNKPLDDYCKRTDMPDGREYRCKKCEAQRVKVHTAKKTAERAGAARKAG